MNGEIVKGMSFEAYRRLPRVNWSSLKLMGKSPAHYRHHLVDPPPDTGPKKVGRATHLAALQPERFRSECVLWDGGRRYGKEWDAFQAKHAGLEILTESEMEDCCRVQEAVRSNAMAAKYLSGGVGELSILWEHQTPPAGGLPGFVTQCKSRVDFAQAGALVDLKTCRDASPDGFGRAAWSFGYQAQAAFYVDAYRAVTGRRLPYIIVAVETAPPYAVQVYRLTDDVLELGRETYQALLNRLHLCQETATWPAYADAELDLVPPRWATEFHEDEDATGLGLVFNAEGAQP